MTVTEHEPTTISTLDEETRRLFVRAKGILSNGWTQGRIFDKASGFCAVGAIYQACGWQKWFGEEAICMLEDLLDEDELMQEGALRPLAVWNDRPERTQQDVIDLIDRALTE